MGKDILDAWQVMKNVICYNVYIEFIHCIWFFTLILIFFTCQVSELFAYIFMAQNPVQIFLFVDFFKN